MKLELEMNLDNAAFRDEDWNLNMESVAWHLDRVIDAIRRDVVLRDHVPDREPVRALFHIRRRRLTRQRPKSVTIRTGYPSR